MSKTTFAKIFELPEHQVLVTKELSDDGDGYEVVPATEVRGVRMSMALGFGSKEAADECFEKYDMEMAAMFIKALNEMMP